MYATCYISLVKIIYMRLKHGCPQVPENGVRSPEAVFCEPPYMGDEK